VVGLEGTELTGLERAWLKLVRPAGVILFRRNIADARQTRACWQRLRSCARTMVSAAWTWKAARSTGCGRADRHALRAGGGGLNGGRERLVWPAGRAS